MSNEKEYGYDHHTDTHNPISLLAVSTTPAARSITSYVERDLLTDIISRFLYSKV